MPRPRSPQYGPPLPAEFYNRPVDQVARDLVGCLLLRHLPGGTLLGGRIVETEAYGRDDPASHSFNGATKRNAAMFGLPGRSYVYLSYGVHFCFNVVCGPDGTGEAVLIRALEPRFGRERMRMNRFGSGSPPGGTTEPGVEAPGSTDGSATPRRPDRELCSGPGKLCQALEITREAVDGTSLANGPVTIHPAGQENHREVVATPRIGITKAANELWRFAEVGNPHLSRPVTNGS